MQRPPARPQELISPTEAAQRRGVSVSTATRAMAGTLADAVVDGKLDALHPLSKAWLKQRPQRGPRPGYRKGVDNSDTPPTDLNQRKKLAETLLLEAKVERDSGRLISRALVQHHVFGLLDSTFKRLLGDFPVSAASRVGALVRAGAPLEEQVSLLRTLVGTELHSLKPRASRALRHCSARGHIDASSDSDTPKASPETTTAVRAFAAALQAELASVAVPRIVDLVAKELARKAAGKPWAPEVFDQAMLLVDSVRTEAVHASTVIISSAVAEAMRQTLSTHQEIPDDQNPQETPEETDNQDDEATPDEGQE